MPSSWRSWFWNTVRFVCTSLFALLAVMAVVNGMRKGWYLASAGMALVAAVTGWGAARSFFVGVWVNARRIAVREWFYTKVIPWEDVVEIQHHPTPPVVVRRRTGKPDERVGLTPLATYELLPRGRMLGERAVQGLTWHWERWKASHAASRTS